MRFQLTGKIESCDFHNGVHTTILVTPAPDAYSQPSSYKLKSDNMLGQPGQEITADIAMRGFIRRKPYKDKNTGQPKMFFEDNVILSVVSSQIKPVSAPVAAVSKA
ncbi:MAG: hypothetical protein U9R22_12695 [Pseudomonadota bacterium]|jgi:hypothetical protein|nr:hypothetical protein [Pseudomonadota bacterium]